MAVNPYFTICTSEQKLLEDLISESIQMTGIEIRYLPRSIVRNDDLFGEDYLSTFNAAAPIEAYLKNYEGFEGEGSFLSKFGLEVRDQITFIISQKRWRQIRTEKLLAESGTPLLPEEAITTLPNQYGDGLLLESGTADNYTITSYTPSEGDLIWLPMNQKIYEIKYVEHQAPFYPLGSEPSYELVCESWEYSSERLITGDVDIDASGDEISLDILINAMLLEDGSALLNEDGGIILTEYRIEDTDVGANNELYNSEGAQYIDFTERHRFQQIDRY